MVAPDYQEFANQGPCAIRDNTVICRFRTRPTVENQPCVARLPRPPSGTKAELSVQSGTKTAPDQPKWPPTPPLTSDRLFIRAPFDFPANSTCQTANVRWLWPPGLLTACQCPCLQCRSR